MTGWGQYLQQTEPLRAGKSGREGCMIQMSLHPPHSLLTSGHPRLHFTDEQTEVWGKAQAFATNLMTSKNQSLVKVSLSDGRHHLA